MKTIDVPSQKRCSGCKETKDIKCFGIDNARKDGRNPYCKDCKREREKSSKDKYAIKKAESRKRYLENQDNRDKVNAARREHRKNNPDKIWAKFLRERYHITPERYEEIFQSQNGLCAICQKPATNEDKLVIDHDHKCCPEKGKSCGECIRGLLHASCNGRLGHIEDVEWLANAFQYIMENGGI